MLHIVLALSCLLGRSYPILFWMADWVLYRYVVAIVLVGPPDGCAMVDVLALRAARLRIGYVGRLAGYSAVGVRAGSKWCEIFLGMLEGITIGHTKIHTLATLLKSTTGKGRRARESS